MIIKFSPQRRNPIQVSKQGDIIIINDESIDLSSIPEGAILPANAIDNEFIIGDVERINGELHLTIISPHGPNATEVERFPQPITVTEDGEIPLP